MSCCSFKREPLTEYGKLYIVNLLKTLFLNVRKRNGSIVTICWRQIKFILKKNINYSILPSEGFLSEVFMTSIIRQKPWLGKMQFTLAFQIFHLLIFLFPKLLLAVDIFSMKQVSIGWVVHTQTRPNEIFKIVYFGSTFCTKDQYIKTITIYTCIQSGKGNRATSK